MGTRSTIAIQNEDGSVTGIYVHWDGYMSHNGAILKDHYSSDERVQELLSHGQISSLGPEIGEQHPFDTYCIKEEDRDPRWENWCLFYGRDRGETDVDAEHFASWEDMLNTQGQEYNYIWEPKDSCWYVEYYGCFGKLEDEMAKEAQEA